MHCHGGAADDNASYCQSGAAEDGNIYCQSSTADNVVAYPLGGEAKDDAPHHRHHHRNNPCHRPRYLTYLQYLKCVMLAEEI
jgi:hypothetical protein